MAGSDANQVLVGGKLQTNDETNKPLSDLEQTDVSFRASDSQCFTAQTSEPVSDKPHEEAVSEPQLEAERPRTAVTIYSEQTDFDHTEDGILLADIHQRYDDGGSAAARVLGPLKEPTMLFSRPKVPEADSFSSIFSFAKASWQQFELNGASKRPIAQSDNAVTEDATSQAGGATNRSHQIVTVPMEEKIMSKKNFHRCDAIDETAPARICGIEVADQHPVSSPAALLEQQQKHQIADIIEHMDNPDTLVPSFEQDQEAFNSPYERIDPIKEASPRRMQLHPDLQAATFGHKPGDVAHGQRDNLLPASSPPPPPETPAPALPAERSVRSSHQHGRHTSRMSKPKSKAKHKTSQPDAEEALSDCSVSDTNDYVQILSYKINQHRQSAFAKFEAKIDMLQRELQHMTATKDAMQQEFDAVQQQNNSLCVEVEQQKNKICAYESKISRFKTFVDGLGNDVDALKRDATANRRKHDRVFQQSKDQMDEQTALFGQLSACAEKAYELKTEAMKICQESQTELQIASLRIETLESQLSERLGLLAEERDRRAQLERQLTSTGSDEKILHAIKRHNDVVIDKLFEIHATVEQAGNADTVSEKICEAMTAIQALKSASADEIVSIKATVEDLSNSITLMLDQNDINHTNNPRDYVALESRLIDVVDRLRSDLSEREKSIEQMATDRQNIATLRDQLQAKDTSVRDLSFQVTDLRTREAELVERNASLKAEVDKLHECSKTADDSRGQIDDLRAELASKTNALEAVQTENVSKAEELRTQVTANSTLQEELQSVQLNLKEVQTQNLAFDAERVQLESKFRGEFKKLQKELSEHAETTYRKEKMKVDNLVQKLAQENSALEKEVHMLRRELEAVTTDREKINKEQSNSEAESNGGSNELQRQLEISKEETAALEKALQHALQRADSIEQQNKHQSSQLAAEKAKHEESVGENIAIAAQVEDLQRAVKMANSANAAAKSKFDQYRGESNLTLQDLQAQLDEAKNKLKKNEQGFEQYVMMRDAAAADAAAKSARQLSALQDNLVEEQRRFHEQEAKHNEFLTEFEKYTKKTEDSHDRAMNEANCNVRDTKTQLDKALMENAGLKAEVQRLSALNILHDAAHLHHPELSQTFTLESSISPVHASKPSITPTTSNKENEPPKMKRKGDRLTSAFAENEPIPVPQILRPDSNQSNKSLRDLMVGDSQFSAFMLSPGPPQPPQTDSQGSHSNVDRSVHANASLENEEMLDTGLIASKRIPRTIEETPFDDKLPSFAAFNKSIMSSQVDKSEIPSSVLSVRSLQGFSGKYCDNIGSATDGTLNHQRSINIVPGSQHFGDSDVTQGFLDTQQADRAPQDSLVPSQVEADKYTYRKSFPNPNSASKRVHHDLDDRQSLKSHQSSRGSVHTPRARGESQQGGGTSRHSSSPDFIYATGTRKNNTYQTPAGSGGGTHRVAWTSSTSIADPRLSRREPPSLKRKAEDHVIEGYEHVRSKQAGIAPQSGPTGTSRYALRGSDRHSIKDLPSSSNLSSRKERETSRMRTSGNLASRSLRSSRKLSKRESLVG